MVKSNVVEPNSPKPTYIVRAVKQVAWPMTNPHNHRPNIPLVSGAGSSFRTIRARNKKEQGKIDAMRKEGKTELDIALYQQGDVILPPWKECCKGLSGVLLSFQLI